MKFTAESALLIYLVASPCARFGDAFVQPLFRAEGTVRTSPSDSTSQLRALGIDDKAGALEVEKKKLLDLLRVTDPTVDPVLADPCTKEPLNVDTQTNVLGSDIVGRGVKYVLKSTNNTFSGSSDTFINLLEPVKKANSSDDTTTTQVTKAFASNLLPFIPPPLRSTLRTAGLPVDGEFVPMRDLFTSPTVSFAYERGWRQGFRQAGFPGPDKEAAMAMDYFDVPMASSPDRVLVDMSCATGLFTRRFAASGKYKRVLGCDYSESMLTEARRRIQSDRDLRNLEKTRLDLVRLDVGQIPMKGASLDALHAGAAMHCWPELTEAVSEIYRVLKPGGRYFATTFLSSYFRTLQLNDGVSGPSRQAFQYFESTDQLRSLLESGGFEREKILIEVLGNACVVIRCEK